MLESYNRKTGRPQIHNPMTAPKAAPKTKCTQNPNQSLSAFLGMACEAA